MAEQEQPNQPTENKDESAPQQPAKKGFDTKFFLLVFAFSCVFTLIFESPLYGLGLFWMNKSGLKPGYSGDYGKGLYVTNVPDPYKQIFLEAGEEFDVQPAFIAAIFYGGEHAESWPNSNGPWASSPRGAQGPFQFIPSTWNGHKQDGDDDGIMNVQNLSDSAFAASHLLSQIGAGNNTTDPSKLIDAAAKYNSGRAWIISCTFKETRKYVPRVMKAFNNFLASTRGISKISSSGWQMPTSSSFRVVSWWDHGTTRGGSQHRGIDFTTPIGTKLLATKSGTVICVGNGYPNLPSGQSNFPCSIGCKALTTCPSGPGRGAGNFIRIQTPEGNSYEYHHLSPDSMKNLSAGGRLYQIGDTVRQGDVIAESGHNGYSSGPHLHFQINQTDNTSTNIDPAPLLGLDDPRF